MQSRNPQEPQAWQRSGQPKLSELPAAVRHAALCAPFFLSSNFFLGKTGSTEVRVVYDFMIELYIHNSLEFKNNI